MTTYLGGDATVATTDAPNREREPQDRRRASNGPGPASDRAWRHPVVRVGTYAWALVGIILTAALLVFGLVQARIVVVPLLLATFPAAVLAPLSRRLRSRGWGRNAASAAVFAGGLAITIGAVALVAVRVSSELPDVVTAVQDGYEQLRQRLADGAFGLPAFDLQTLVDGLREGIAGGGEGEGDAGSGTQAIAAAESALRLLAQTALMIVVVFFLIRDGDRIGGWLVSLVPTRYRDHAAEIGGRVSETVGDYIRGQAVIATFEGVLMAVALLILGIPLAAALGFIVFLGAFVPVVGAFTAGAAAVLVALAAEGLAMALVVLAIMVVVQQLEGNVLAPIVLGRSVDLHPLAILVGLTLGGFLMGVVGAIIAVPLTASLHRAASYVGDRSTLWATEQQPA
ncbi:MAG: AI-2E family transporter [Actinobacteria bacterium]|nr:AI-2E family transporter [Actinomycetota bacterium]